MLTSAGKLGLRSWPMLVAILSCAACSGAAETPADRSPPREVGYVVLTPETVALPIELPGRTAAFETSEVRPQVSGIVQARLFSEGKLVRAGETLYRIDPRLYEAALAEARAAFESSVASLGATRARARRLQALVQSGAVSQQDLLDAEAAADAAAAESTRVGAALETARINLKFTRVTAPISGRIGRSFVTTGALVTAGQSDPLATIQRLDPMFVDIQQSSGELLALRSALAQGGTTVASTEVSLRLEDGSTYPLRGRLEFAESVVEEGTGSVTVRARFANPDGLLLPGMYVRAQFAPVQVRDAILAPQQGITRDARGNATALVVGADGAVEERTVVADRTIGDRWLIRSGLASGERLIVEGVARVAPGDAVRAVPVTPSVPAARR